MVHQIIEEPNSKESEMMVIGCMLVSEDFFHTASQALDVLDFYYEEHKIIFHTIQTLHKDKKPADVHLVAEDLRKKGNLREVGGVNYLVVLAQYAGTSAHIEEYIDIVKNKSVLRKLLHVGKNLEKVALSDSSNLQTHLNALQRELESIQRNQYKPETYYAKLLQPTSEREVSEEIRKISPGVRVGFHLDSIDLKIPGGSLTVLAGPTGHGKTLVAINMLINYLAIYPEKKVYFFSYEESRASILSVFLSVYIGETISYNNRECIRDFLRDGNLSTLSKEKQFFFHKKKEEFFKNLVETGRLNICYCNYSAEELSESIYFLNEKSQIGLVAIDHIQMLRTSRRKQMLRQEELKEICILLKEMAVNTGLPILLGAQFNRTVINEASMSPLAIGEAGDIERFAHTVVGLWNRNYEGLTEDGDKGKDMGKKPKESSIYLEILKGRDSGIGHSEVFYLHGNSGKLTNQKSLRSTPRFG